MTKFWPIGLELSDTQSPLEILLGAKKEWELSSDGLLTLILQETKSSRGNDMVIVHALHVASNRTTTLFSVISRGGHPYPATLQPKDEELPDFLKKRYETESTSVFSAISRTMGGASETKVVTNEWVADTPGEFRLRLEKVFNLGSIKSEILNLIASGDVRTDESSSPVSEPDAPANVEAEEPE